MLNKTQNIKCGWCKGKNTAEKWNDTTFAECKSREMRRAFTQIYKEMTFTRKANTFYKCPSCGTWSRGCQLEVVDTEDRKLLSLGKEPIMREVIEDED